MTELGSPRAARAQRIDADRQSKPGVGGTDFLQQQIDLGAYNPFGGVINQDDVLAAIATSIVRQGKSDLTMLTPRINGDLFEIAAGALKMALESSIGTRALRRPGQLSSSVA